jgi:tripartite-type tricarboxylate transporter receptor subunit TctC
MKRRSLLGRSAALALGWTAAGPLFAQEAFPSRPVEVIVPWGAGGGADVLGRIVGKWMEGDLKGSFPVMNMPGASGMIGLGRMVSKPGDGYTISVLTGDSLMMAATPTASVKWNDMVALGVLVRQPSGIFAPPGSKYKTWQDVTRAVQANPGSVSIAITGPNTADDLTVQYLTLAKKLALGGVPFTKPGERYAAVLGGHVDLLYEQAGDVRTFLDAGKLQPLIFFSANRLPAPFADVPVSGELGYDIQLPQVRAMLAKADTDPHRLALLAASIERFAKSAEYRAFLDQQLALPDSFIPVKAAQTFLNGEFEASRKLLVAYGSK